MVIHRFGVPVGTVGDLAARNVHLAQTERLGRMEPRKKEGEAILAAEQMTINTWKKDSSNTSGIEVQIFADVQRGR